MPIRFVCLANSYKEGGRCLAGIQLDRKNSPIIGYLGPKWIRPIYPNEHGEIPKDLVAHIHLLDVIEIESDANSHLGYQSENVLFNQHSIEKMGTFPVAGLNDLIETERPKIFGNLGKAIAADQIHLLKYSLMLVRVLDFRVFKKPHEDKLAKPQIRMVFIYKRTEYEFPVTDPVFLDRYRQNQDCLAGVRELFLTLSVGLPFEDWHYKLIAGVMHA